VTGESDRIVRPQTGIVEAGGFTELGRGSRLLALNNEYHWQIADSSLEMVMPQFEVGNTLARGIPIAPSPFFLYYSLVRRSSVGTIVAGIALLGSASSGRPSGA
jgi:hypothetical protein